MNALPQIQSDVPTKASRIHPLVAAAAVSVILACGTGIAAMTGLLPSSKATATTVTASPLVDAQVAGTAPSQPASQKNTPLPRAVRGHHVNPARAVEPVRETVQPAQNPVPAYDPYAGQVTAVNAVQTAQPSTGIGAIGGAVVGGLAGTQIGNGRGRTAATILGAIGGGLAGNQIEHVVHKTTTYQVQVRMNDGNVRSFNYDAAPGVAVGQKVRVSGETLTPA
ncbi:MULTISPECIES: glycine zipper 2TM domain-containing protein [unclassified Caballeronia]|uniref:glycine zipper 2TM domain-containing protein n=1 Tax=unclassified Caballeronia TaxID=2646786 RepID=UPI002858C9EB|nr:MULTISPECIES: glycine zipper 2TM domain-containing protein [unclassified Caballeronia]MDR5812469.1 glycine zipper 2TM domain-containing protein [Caballeronia sp. LZ033]MDR5819294.1 glycine zipper 2TM domain-containing protein [Caballeronia sp. LZ043]